MIGGGIMTFPANWRIASASPYPGSCTFDLTRALEVLTKEAINRLGKTGQTIFFLGDGLQQAATDGIFDFFSPSAWTPDNIARLTAMAGQQAVRTSELFISPRTAQLAWLELRNKLEIFVLVQNVNSMLGIPEDASLSLPELLEKAYSLPPFEALWAVEGMGHNYTESYWKVHGSPKGLLFEENAPAPEKSLLMLHAGMGLFFAKQLLGPGTPTLTPVSPPGEFRAVIDNFVRLARDNARPGYIGPVIESLGLYTRDFQPDMVRSVHQALLQAAPELTGFYWHGVGRALYFSRRYFLPVLSTIWTGIDSEVAATEDRLSAMAGLTWAVALVNMREPQILECALRTYIERSPVQDGFANGIASSVIMRQDTTPNAPFIASFCEYRPADKHILALWDRLIAGPCRMALREYYPVLGQYGALGEVFRYQDLAALVSRLKNSTSLPMAAASRPAMDEVTQPAIV